MKLYIFRTGTVISPFGDDVSQAQVLLSPLAEHQDKVARRLGLEPARIDHPAQAIERPCLLAADYLFFTEKVLGDFLAAVKNSNRPAQLALPRRVSVEHTLPLQELELLDWDSPTARALYHLWYLKDGETLPEQVEAALAALRQKCQPLSVPVRELVRKIRLPVVSEKEQYFNYPFTSSVCCHIRHWVHLLWLSQLALGIAWNDYWRAHKLRSAAKALWAVLKHLSLNRWRVLSGMNVIGPDCDIHPTAYLEFSMLGRGVKVGAGACIRNSLLGDGVEVADQAVVLNSVVAERCFLTENFFLVSSLCYPGSTLGNLKTQMAVIGRDVYLHGWCSLLDAKFVGDIKVRQGGKTVATGRSFMSSCIGHRAVLGAKILIHPGREVPNDLLLVSRPEDVIAEIPDNLPARVPLVRDQGTLVPLESLKK
jgi:carbonic anhydrase/acetyltransferase-like protein (isoleucine patch superfamily)